MLKCASARIDIFFLCASDLPLAILAPAWGGMVAVFLVVVPLYRSALVFCVVGLGVRYLLYRRKTRMDAILVFLRTCQQHVTIFSYVHIYG